MGTCTGDNDAPSFTIVELGDVRPELVSFTHPVAPLDSPAFSKPYKAGLATPA